MRRYRIDNRCAMLPRHQLVWWLETDDRGLKVEGSYGRWTTRGGLRESTRLTLGKCCTVDVHEVAEGGR